MFCWEGRKLVGFVGAMGEERRVKVRVLRVNKINSHFYFIFKCSFDFMLGS